MCNTISDPDPDSNSDSDADSDSDSDSGSLSQSLSLRDLKADKDAAQRRQGSLASVDFS